MNQYPTTRVDRPKRISPRDFFFTDEIQKLLEDNRNRVKSQL